MSIDDVRKQNIINVLSKLPVEKLVSLMDIYKKSLNKTEIRQDSESTYFSLSEDAQKRYELMSEVDTKDSWVNAICALKSVPTEYAADERTINERIEHARTAFRAKFVGMDHILETLLLHMVSYIRTGKVSPLLFVGPPGCGKTEVAKLYLTEMLNLCMHFVSCPQLSAGGGGLLGDKGVYKDATYGELISAVLKNKSWRVGYIYDEVDKIFSRNDASIEDEMLSVFDQSANNLSENFMNIKFDISHAGIVATANELDEVSKPLRDRCDVIFFTSPDLAQIKNIVSQHILPQVMSDIGCKDNITVNPDVVDAFVEENFDRLSLREFKTTFKKIASKAYLSSLECDGKYTVSKDDMDAVAGKEFSTVSKRVIGFHNEL